MWLLLVIFLSKRLHQRCRGLSPGIIIIITEVIRLESRTGVGNRERWNRWRET